MVINLVLGCLSIFAQTRTDVATQGNDVEEKTLCRVVAFARLCRFTQLGKDLVVERSALPCNLLFSHHVRDKDGRHIVGIGQVGRRGEATQFE